MKKADHFKPLEKAGVTAAFIRENAGNVFDEKPWAFVTRLRIAWKCEAARGEARAAQSFAAAKASSGVTVAGQEALLASLLAAPRSLVPREEIERVKAQIAALKNVP
jgi:hypothetical protein